MLAIVAASRLASQFAPWLDAHTPLGAPASLVIGYLAILAAGLVLTAVAARLVEKAVHLTILGLVDRIGGAVCGLVLGTLLVSIGLIAISAAPGGRAVRATVEDSALGRAVYRAAPNLYLGARRLAGRQGDRLWQELLDRSRDALDEVQAPPDPGPLVPRRAPAAADTAAAPTTP